MTGIDNSRVRTSQIRVELAKNGGYASAYLADYAAMAALSYQNVPGLGDSCRQRRAVTSETTDMAQNVGKSWIEVSSELIAETHQCEEQNNGFYARVWERRHNQTTEVVIAFRGTNSTSDWINGNLYWFTKRFVKNDQYKLARELTDLVLRKYSTDSEANERELIVRTVGHSLGGGLAQHALYTYPEHVAQVFAFHPSPVTGYFRNKKNLPLRIAACSSHENIGHEARIYRIYESGEVLAYLRYPFKRVLPLSRHINEVRFNFSKKTFISQHSIWDMARGMYERAVSTDGAQLHWLAAEPSQCSGVLSQTMETAYDLDSSIKTCPNRPSERYKCASTLSD